MTIHSFNQMSWTDIKKNRVLRHRDFNNQGPQIEPSVAHSGHRPSSRAHTDPVTRCDGASRLANPVWPGCYIWVNNTRAGPLNNFVHPLERCRLHVPLWSHLKERIGIVHRCVYNERKLKQKEKQCPKSHKCRNMSSEQLRDAFGSGFLRLWVFKEARRHGGTWKISAQFVQSSVPYRCKL